MSDAPLRILIVDDEAPARIRLRDLLGDIAVIQPGTVVGMVANGVEALRLIEAGGVDVVLADIHMPAMDGVELARRVAGLPQPPDVIFTTAYDRYAVEAFELAATDYLLKPVRAERLAAALAKVRARQSPPVPASAASDNDGDKQYFSISERGRILLLAVAEVIYLKAELKYVTARTAEREYVLAETLVQIEQEFGERFVRIHRNCLVARSAIQGVKRAGDTESEAHWEILLAGVDERLPVSRRQWATVRQKLGL